MPQSDVRINIQATDSTQGAVRSASQGIKELQTRVKELQQIQKDAMKAVLAAPNATQSKQASADLVAVTKDLTTAQKELSQANKVLGGDLNNSALSAKGLFTSFTAANLAATAITSTIEKVTDQFRESVKVAEQYNLTMSGLASASAAFGEDARQVQLAAQTASSDGLVPLVSNAGALRDLLQSGLSLDQATELMARMKDEAAFGRANTIEYGTAVENLAQAFKTEQSTLGNLSGHADNFSKAIETGAAAMGKNVAELSEAERLQAKYIGYLQQGAYAQGDAARYAATSAGEQARLNYQQLEAQRILGTSLLPAVTMMRQGWIQLITGGIAPTAEASQQLQGIFLALATGARLAMNAAMGLGRGIVASADAIRQRSLEPLRQAAAQTSDDFMSTFGDMDEGFKNIVDGAYDAAQGQTALANTVADESGKAVSKMQRDIDEANKQFARSQAQRVKDFREALEDMVIVHRDKSRSIQADIAEETAAYRTASVEREAALNKDLAKLGEQHSKKVGDITKKISEERERGVIVDGVLYANANQEKIAELEAELAAEQAAYQTAINERNIQYAQDVANDKARHDAKMTDLQATLAEERAILERHAADVAAVGEKQKEDDISRLKRKYAEETELANIQHAEAVARIRQQGTEQGASYMGGYAAGVRAKAPEMQSAADAAFSSFMKGVEKGVASGGLAYGTGKKEPINYADIAKTAAGVALNLLNPIGFMASSATKLLGFAEGGTINRPTLLVDKATGQPYGQMAERGPEDIVPRGGTRQGGSRGVTVNIKEQHFHSELDQTSFLRRMYWEGRR